MGFSTVPEALKAAGSTAHSAAVAVGKADCGNPAEDIGAALPGSTAGGAGLAFAAGWSTAWTSWLEDAHAHARSLTAAADNYSATESHNADNVRTAQGGER